MAGTATIRLRDTAGRLRDLPRSSMIEAAKATKKIAAEEAARAGSPLVKHGRQGRVRRIRLRAIDDIRVVDGGVVRCRVKGVPVGPWVWVNTGTRAHVIPRARKRRTKTARYLALPNHPVRVPPVEIHHPGTAGGGAWRRVVRRAERVVPDIFRDDVARAVNHG